MRWRACGRRGRVVGGLLVLALAAGLVTQAAAAGWQEFSPDSASGGGMSNTPTRPSNRCTIAMNSAGNPVIAWDDGPDNAEEIYVRQFDGVAWAEKGAGSASSGGISSGPTRDYDAAMCHDRDGHCVVAWATSGGDALYVKRFNGTAWVEVGAGSASGRGISDGGYGAAPALVLDASGNLVIAWEHSGDGSSNVYVKRFNGTAWTAIGPGSASGLGVSQTRNAYWPQMCLDASNGILVTYWALRGSAYEVYVKRFNGSAWEEVGAGSGSGGGISNNSGESRRPAICLDGNNRPVVAWFDNSGGTWEVYAKRFNGTAWEDMGAGSASGGGISNLGNDYSGSCPAICRDSSGRVVVAWAAKAKGRTNYEIYVRRFNDTAWEEIGGGSATGGGITNTMADSKEPVIAAGTAGSLVLAWSELVGGQAEIYVRKYVENAPPTASAGPEQAVEHASAAGVQVALDGSASFWLVAGDHTLKLRAERSGKGRSRIYTITIQATDASGNASTATCTVSVPHDQKKPGGK